MPLEITMLLFALLLLALQTAGQGAGNIIMYGAMKAAGARDSMPAAHPGFAGRLQRALNNYKENLLFFIPLVLAAAALGISNENTQFGAQLFVIARAIYIPLYLFGIPLRPVAFGAGLAGCAMIAYGILTHTA